MPTAPLPALSLLETRVLGVLVEKQHTVPDSYPLTLNALVSGCNQKTSRHPVIEASEAEAQAALDHLKSLSLVVESSGGPARRTAPHTGPGPAPPGPPVPLPPPPLLRGPQTAGELRINSERLHAFPDISAVEAFLEELAPRPAGALVAELPRLAGTRETRWAHLLSGAPAEPAAAEAAAAPAQAASLGEIAALKANVDRLEAEVAELRETLARVVRELGL